MKRGLILVIPYSSCEKLLKFSGSELQFPPFLKELVVINNTALQSMVKTRNDKIQQVPVHKKACSHSPISHHSPQPQSWASLSGPGYRCYILMPTICMKVQIFSLSNGKSSCSSHLARHSLFDWFLWSDHQPKIPAFNLLFNITSLLLNVCIANHPSVQGSHETQGLPLCSPGHTGNQARESKDEAVQPILSLGTSYKENLV